MSEEQLEPFLPKSFNHKIEKFCRLDASSFNALVRVDIKSEEDVDNWRREFQEQSGTNFIVGHTYPDVQRTQFKKEFVCHRSSKNKLDSEKDKRRSSIKLNANCKAKIVVIIKLNTEKTRRTDHLIREGFLGAIQISWSHSHSVGSENIDSLSKSRPSKTIEEDFIAYFKAGMSASQAKLHHQGLLQSQPDFNAAITLANSSVNPKDCVVENWYDKWRTDTHGNRSGAKMIEKLHETIQDLSAEGVKIVMSKFPFAIAIVTPIASRAHSHEMSKRIAFVDSTASCDLAGHTVTFLLTASNAGALPLGALITNSQGQEAYTTGFKLLRELLGCESFGGKGYPAVFFCYARLNGV